MKQPCEIEICSIKIGSISQLIYSDGRKNNNHRANSRFFDNLLIDWSEVDNSKTLDIEIYNPLKYDVKLDICFWVRVSYK